ncbi:YdeI/OmpD-associated family protein [Ramlibacter albus]|uniref:YdeI/OmpD-associated family protein n=1 Tax=Ramlibacter albus TaxID=2079448 RepID=A0A923M9S9_9BURK|nr:YdeI/OmpD-associated family protein [Ramlibacter albus]MBC5765384.1 YdeI/OmpD-associated family protein [Ramlibacter albus]
MSAEPVFFESAAKFRAWLKRNAASAGEIVVGFYKVGTGRPSMTWSESVDEALCFGWIDGVRKGIDAESYQIRFTPRRPGSNWSAINVEKVRVLTQAGRMTEAGLRAFADYDPDRSRNYSYEQRSEAKLSADEEARFRRSREAWAFFEKQPPGWRQLQIYRVVSAKRVETREGRLGRLIEACARGERLA